MWRRCSGHEAQESWERDSGHVVWGTGKEGGAVMSAWGASGVEEGKGNARISSSYSPEPDEVDDCVCDGGEDDAGVPVE